MIHHIIIAYGPHIGYQHGAKYQILRLISKFGIAERKITLVTDHPQLFDAYPVEILHLDALKKKKWGGSGADHFGIKLKGFVWAASLTDADSHVLLDTDMYWTRDPSDLIEPLHAGLAVMYRDEGLIFGTRNRSIKRFEEGLSNRQLTWSEGVYTLDQESRMYGSAIIGMSHENIALIDQAFELFKRLSNYVEAHTVEQFALSECLRLTGVEITEGRRYTNDWSSIGKKNYVTPVLAEFFERVGEHEFEAHLESWTSIPIHRPMFELLKQKVGSVRSKR